jgi:hypothetical protein
MDRLYELAEKSNSLPDQRFFHLIHYSGHGSYENATDKNETDGRDECIIASDDIILDNLLRIGLEAFGSNSTILFIFDCCFSGTILDLKYNYTVVNGRESGQLITEPTDGQKPLRANIFCLSSSQDDTTSIENGGMGILSSHLYTLHGNNRLASIGIKDFLKQFSDLVATKKTTVKQVCGLCFENYFERVDTSASAKSDLHQMRLFDFKTLASNVER